MNDDETHGTKNGEKLKNPKIVISKIAVSPDPEGIRP